MILEHLGYISHLILHDSSQWLAFKPLGMTNILVGKKQSGQIIATSAEVTPNGGLVRESPQNPLNSGLGIIVICPVTMCFCWLLTSLELTAKAPENGWDWKTFSFPFRAQRNLATVLLLLVSGRVYHFMVPNLMANQPTPHYVPPPRKKAFIKPLFLTGYVRGGGRLTSHKNLTSVSFTKLRAEIPMDLTCHTSRAAYLIPWILKASWEKKLHHFGG